MLHIPQTAPNRYVSSIVALNVHRAPTGQAIGTVRQPSMMMLIRRIFISTAKIKNVVRFICSETLA